MAAQEILKDKIIAAEGNPLDAIHIIVNGSVTARFAGGDIILRKGDVVGLCDIAFDSHSFTYITAEDSSFVSFPIKSKTSVSEIVKSNPEVAKMMLNSSLNQVAMIYSTYIKSREKCHEIYKHIQDLYTMYLDICSHNNVISRTLPVIDELEPFDFEDNELSEWLSSYYASMKDFPQDLKFSLASRVSFLNGFLIKASEDIHAAFSACFAMNEYYNDNICAYVTDSHLDLFDLFSSLHYRLKPDTPDANTVSSLIEKIVSLAKESGTIDNGIIDARLSDYRSKSASLSSPVTESNGSDAPVSEEVKNALNIILDYSGIAEEEANNFRLLISKYKKVSDKASSEEPIRKLRLEITKAFYHIYSEAFQMSIREVELPTIMKMFFNFGFIDYELLSPENVNYLYHLAEDFRGNPEKGIYTAYEWLRAIYFMEKEPSRNEFDTDYLAYLHEQKVAGKLTPEQEAIAAKDPGERVMFELNNMFPLVNKVTYGRLSSFCPVLSEHDVIKPLQNCLVTIEGIYECYRKIEEIDYGAFYRETIYANDACQIQKEIINQRILPDVILFPNIGTRGVMWQEIEGKRRTTPSRFMISTFHMEDLMTTVTRLIGEYRWEMCKRIQGARWNDVSDRSLTSEYFDYVQFYRKNSELSTDAKEKVKTALQKAKNSFKEMFVRDYITWVLFEGAGSPRLNKVVRQIMVTYCPFPKELREKIGANPLFKELIERYEIKNSQKLHHFDNVITKLKSSNMNVPKELSLQRNFIEGTVENEY